jgi:hypothetical protein
MSNIDYKAEVLHHNVNYRYVFFENSISQHHIRQYTTTPPYCKTIGMSCISENHAWEIAYENLKSKRDE